jgi:putative nucleotidyltransferase with HDIG domain
MTFKKLPRGYKIYVPLVLMLIFFVFMLPRTPRFGYEYKKGEHWMYETLVAEFDFPILKTEEALKAERDSAKTVKIPYFDKKESVVDSVMARLDRRLMPGTRRAVALLRDTVLTRIYSKGVFSPNDAAHYMNAHENDVCSILANDFESVNVPVLEVYTLESAREYVKNAFAKAGFTNDEYLFKALDINGLIVPDLDYNSKITEDRYSDKLYHPSYTSSYMSRSEVIVEKGALITDGVANLLDSYRAEFDRSVGYSGNVAALWSGLFIVALVMVVLFFFTLYFTNYSIFTEYNKYLYVLLLYVLFSSITFLFYSRGELDMYYMIPYSLMSMLMMSFFQKGFVMIMYFITLLPLLIVTSGTVNVFFMHLVAGFMALYIFKNLEKGWYQFVGSFIIYLIMVVVWVGFCLFFDNVGNWYLLLYIALGAGLAIAGYPLVYLFERMFSLVSSGRLVELSDTSNTLLRLLADKAPGTFHHSLQVMNLADAAARAVDADIPLVRAAALYHDIGKINYPQCFTENEAPGVKVHDGLTPKESARLIIKHVSDGLELADKHKLPKVLKDFISTHHGTTTASYFLTKYLNDGGDPEDVADFQYEGQKPVTKEQVILMLSDGVEAASRSLKDYSNESIARLVDKIVDGKAQDGQLDNADITLKELNIIKDVMKSFVQQVYHSRIEYPKRIKASKK